MPTALSEENCGSQKIPPNFESSSLIKELLITTNFLCQEINIEIAAFQFS